MFFHGFTQINSLVDDLVYTWKVYTDADFGSLLISNYPCHNTWQTNYKLK